MAENKISSWIRQNKAEAVILGLIILIALVLRLYHINEFMTFLGDEGRDVRIVRDLITKGNLVFIGPQTSVGNMYLGPLYYYMMAPALFFSGLNPVGPAIMNALIGTFTVGLTWFVGRIWFRKSAGLLAAFFFAISPVGIIYSRSSWNPNPMPLFALICIWGIYEVWKNKKYFWLPIVGISFAAALQMHYLGLLLLPALGLFWLISLWRIKDIKSEKNIYLKKTFIAIAIFLVMMSPLFLFDLKHNGTNLNAFTSFFSNRQTTVNLNPARSDRFIPVILQTVTDLVLARQSQLAVITSILIFISTVVLYLKIKSRSTYKVLLVWLGFALLGLSVYKQHVYIHYMGFIYPAIYLLLGAILAFLLANKNKILKIISLLIIVFLSYLNLYHSPVRDTPNRQLQRTQEAVNQIIADSNGQPFNFALIAKQNYDESYRYFFENKKANIVSSDKTATEQLYVVCEDGDTCKPEGHSRYEIAMFGIAHVDKQWNLDNLKIYRLVHTK